MSASPFVILPASDFLAKHPHLSHQAKGLELLIVFITRLMIHTYKLWARHYGKHWIVTLKLN